MRVRERGRAWHCSCAGTQAAATAGGWQPPPPQRRRRVGEAARDGDGGAAARARPQRAPAAARNAAAHQTLAVVALWYLSNTSVLVLNKMLLSFHGFRFPITLTMIHMVRAREPECMRQLSPDCPTTCVTPAMPVACRVTSREREPRSPPVSRQGRARPHATCRDTRAHANERARANAGVLRAPELRDDRRHAGGAAATHILG